MIKLEEVIVEDMLAARDRRVELQRRLLQEYKQPLICFTMNIPGPIKVTPLVKQGFQEGCRAINKVLQQSNMPVLAEQYIEEKTGLEAYYIVEGSAKYIKALTSKLENQDALGRLFDIDVLGVDGRKLSREELGLPGRLCLVCNESAQACARSRNHTLDVLTKHVHKILEEHLLNRVEKLAHYALLAEVKTTPKPGLVDLDNTGAHGDMDVHTFELSTEAIVPFFRQMAERGYSWQGSGEGLFLAIRPIGAAAEKAMFKATGNVNTHKGIIFSLGLMVSFSMWYFAQQGVFAVEEILKLIGTSVSDILEKDFAKIDKYHPHTHGEKLFVKYGYKGIRGEVQQGFKPLQEIALPVLRKLLAEGRERNLAYIQTLLELMAKIEDTNILIRTSPEMLDYAQKQAQAILVQGGALTEHGLQSVWQLNEDFVAKNMSPGGAADLLIASIFLVELEA